MDQVITNNEIPLEIWDKVEIVVGDDKGQGIYVSRIEDFNQDGFIITKPDWIRGGKGLTFYSYVYVQFKKPDAMYRFSARLRPLNGKDSGQLQLFSFGRVERVQRRQFVRIRYTISLKYSIVKDSEGTAHQENWVSSMSEDVSAGGMLIRTQGEVSENDLVILRVGRFDVMGIPPFIAGICRRKTRFNEQSVAGIEFLTDDTLHDHFSDAELAKLPPQLTKFNRHVQNRLVRFVFEEQVRERQKGLL